MSRAVFVLAHHGGGYAGMIRPSGDVDLPGGMVEDGESDMDALRRHAAEDGWQLGKINPQPILVLSDPAFVPDCEIVWYKAESAEPLVGYKEGANLRPITLTAEEVRASGVGNGLVPPKQYGRS